MHGAAFLLPLNPCLHIPFLLQHYLDVGEREEETFEVEELEILGRQRQEWRQAGKKKKPAVLLSIWEEMQGLDRNKELRGSKVQTKCKLIQDWLKKPLHSKKPRITLRSSYKYSVWAVVRELYQEQIQLFCTNNDDTYTIGKG
ncbi:hypothetical protein BKA82DRAFT_4017809 [Pisolithus tinctorius]|nr:hypothetical protein BKA82DRAFT_4017809 [Pisolithus tinctorius]